LKKERKKVNLSTAVISSIATFAVTLSVCYIWHNMNYNNKVYSLLNEADSIVKKKFYQDIDEDLLADGVLSGYMSGLDDKYARYQTPVEYKSTVVSDSGHLIGIGITVKSTDDGYMQVTELADESSARDAGLLTDDIIKEVDGNNVAEIGYNEAVKLIKSGDSDTDVTLVIIRNGEEKTISVKRIEMTVTTSSGQMVTDDIGYIKITQFNSTTAEQMKETLSELIEEGAEKIIFDVRNNPGGMVSSVEECIDPFLPEGDIAIATYHDGSTEVICHSDAEELDIPIVILINGNSASGAELFSASLRDFGKAELVGVNSYGKGIMQTTHSLSNGGAITFTIATYQTVKSDCYHGVGLAPDYEVEQGENDDIESVNPENDVQLSKAIEVLKGK
jgi:carboxyl-terminal processing protease